MTSRTFSSEDAWKAFEGRDRAADGSFVAAVRSTGIYCKPSCPARRPKRENVRFFPSGESARREGFRPCRRCRPDDVARDLSAVRQALLLIERSEQPPTLAGIAAEVGYAPHHFQRLFTRLVGVSPASYARGRRSERAQAALKECKSVTEAIYEAGHAGPSQFYAETAERLGMAPSAWRDGGRGETIRWAVVESALGPMLLAATAHGICRLSFGEDETSLERHFPNARLIPDDGSLATLVEGALAAVRCPSVAPDLPLDVRGTAFQEAVWKELRKIPAGETRTYAQIAAAVGKPGAVRAAGSANGANPVSVLVPCHRVIRSDGSLGGYAWGLERKRRLLDSEKASGQPDLPL